LTRRLETIQTVAMNRKACSVETSPEFIAASVVTGVPATEPAPAKMTDATLILRSQERSFDFLPIFVCLCLFPLRQHCRRPVSASCRASRALLQFGFENRLSAFI
jgi:hypothetical protein